MCAKSFPIAPSGFVRQVLLTLMALHLHLPSAQIDMFDVGKKKQQKKVQQQQYFDFRFSVNARIRDMRKLNCFLHFQTQGSSHVIQLGMLGFWE